MKFKRHVGAGGEYFGTGSEEDKKLWNRLKNDIAQDCEAFEKTVGKNSPNFDREVREPHKKGGKVGRPCKEKGIEFEVEIEHKAEGGALMGQDQASRPPLKKGGKCM